MSRFKEMKAKMQQQRNSAYQQYLLELDNWVKGNYPAATQISEGLYIVKNTTTTTEKINIGDYIRVHYTGKLLDGTVFDSSRKKGKPFAFVVGEGSVIPAWDIGMQQFAKGESGLIISGYITAYGESGIPRLIPPKSTLIFDVEVLN